jgi:hypothetical protein
MNTIKIQIPEGFQIDSFDKVTGEIKFKPIPRSVTDRIKTIQDVLADNNITQEQFDKSCEGLEPDEVAYRIIKMLAKSLNEGWEPNWDNNNEYKYYPWFDMEGGSSGFRFHDCDFWRSHSVVGSRLCFKSSELATYAGEQFIDVYKKFMIE